MSTIILGWRTPRLSSTKTRIKTYYIFLLLAFFLYLRAHLPLKQGLRHYEEELRKRIDESKTPEERQFYTFLLNSMVIGGL